MEEQQIRFRMADSADIPELVRLRLQYFAEEFGELPAESLRRITAQLPDYFAAHLGRDCFCFAADCGDGRLCSSAILHCAEKPANPFFPGGLSGTVMGVYTEPAYRKRGCATALMTMLLEVARQQGLDMVQLSASRLGRPVYEKLGFRAVESEDTEMKIDL